MNDRFYLTYFSSNAIPPFNSNTNFKKRGRPPKIPGEVAKHCIIEEPTNGNKVLTRPRMQRKKGELRSLADLNKSMGAQDRNLDYDPLHFIRCHAKDTSPNDQVTKVWRCAFEPDPNNPGATTRCIATCGGECVCLIDCELGKVTKRFKREGEVGLFDSRENIWTFAGTGIHGLSMDHAGNRERSENKHPRGWWEIPRDPVVFHRWRFLLWHEGPSGRRVFSRLQLGFAADSFQWRRESVSVRVGYRITDDEPVETYAISAAHEAEMPTAGSESSDESRLPRPLSLPRGWLWRCDVCLENSGFPLREAGEVCFYFESWVMCNMGQFDWGMRHLMDTEQIYFIFSVKYGTVWWSNETFDEHRTDLSYIFCEYWLKYGRVWWRNDTFDEHITDLSDILLLDPSLISSLHCSREYYCTLYEFY